MHMVRCSAHAIALAFGVSRHCGKVCMQRGAHARNEVFYAIFCTEN